MASGNVVKKKKENTLHNWYILPRCTSSGFFTVAVEGVMDATGPLGGQVWHTSAIARRLAADRVATVTGTEYVLRGQFQSLEAMHAGCSLELAEAFAAGFPGDWQRRVEQFHNLKLEQAKSTPEDSNAKQRAKRANSSTRSSEVARFLGASTPAKARASSSSSLPATEDSTTSSMHKRGATSHRSKQSRRAPAKRPRNSDSLFTDAAHIRRGSKREPVLAATLKSASFKSALVSPLTLDALPRTRYGRTVKPPMQGAAIRYDRALDMVVVLGDVADVSCCRVGDKMQLVQLDVEKDNLKAEKKKSSIFRSIEQRQNKKRLAREHLPAD